MRVALSMQHKNIMVLTSYHQSENGTVLIFPFLQGVTLDRYIWGESYNPSIEIFIMNNFQKALFFAAPKEMS
ncbi:hypothetical protein CRYUN_Cryun14cG0083600 [Craigia yunnanensis]